MGRWCIHSISNHLKQTKFEAFGFSFTIEVRLVQLQPWLTGLITWETLLVHSWWCGWLGHWPKTKTHTSENSAPEAGSHLDASKGSTFHKLQTPFLQSECRIYSKLVFQMVTPVHQEENEKWSWQMEYCGPILFSAGSAGPHGLCFFQCWNWAVEVSLGKGNICSLNPFQAPACSMELLRAAPENQVVPCRALRTGMRN